MKYLIPFVLPFTYALIGVCVGAALSNQIMPQPERGLLAFIAAMLPTILGGLGAVLGSVLLAAIRNTQA